MREHDQGKPKLNKKKPPKVLKAASQYNLNAKTLTILQITPKN